MPKTYKPNRKPQPLKAGRQVVLASDVDKAINQLTRESHRSPTQEANWWLREYLVMGRRRRANA